MKLKDKPRIERPREKMERYGAENLTEVELLAILLRTGTKGQNVLEMSRKILKKFPGNKIANASMGELRDTHGLGGAKACEIMACFELGRRILKDKKAVPILSPKSVWEALADIRGNKKEHFVVFYLDVRHQEIKREVVSIGILDANLIHPREVFEPAVIHSAAHIIICHNHPSGNPEPSDEDVVVTNRLVEAGKIMGIKIIDHVIVSKERWNSLREMGLM